MNVIVTGGSGQLGTLLLRRLSADRGVRSITSIDLRPPITASPKVQAIEADVRDPGIARHFAGADALIHLAALVTQAAPREVMQAVNVEGSKNVFRAAVEAGVKTVVYASSIAAYGVFDDHPQPIVEATKRRYQSSFAYSATKFEVEAFLDDFERAAPDVAICRLRPGILVGARMENALGQAFAARIFPDPGSPPLPVVWDEDVADAAMLALKKRAHGSFNLTADEPIPARAFADAAGFRYIPVPRSLLQGLARLPVKLARVHATDPAWLELPPGPMRISSDKAKTELGWKPRGSTSAAVAKRLGEVARGLMDPRLAVFFRLSALAARRMPPMPDAATMRSRIHLDLGGRGGGDVSLVLEGGRLTIQVGAIPRPPTAVITLRASSLLEMLAGTSSFASAQITGKVRIEGEPLAGMVLGTLITLFRTQASDQGPRAWPARRLSQWMAGDGWTRPTR